MASVVAIRTSRVNELTRAIIGAAMRVHSSLGPGLLESAYEACLLFELHSAGLKAESQVPLPVVYRQVKLDLGYRLDLLVEDSVIVELKSVGAIEPVHEAQLLSYLKLSGKHVGLIINFHVVHLKDGIKRLVSGTEWE
ncbi:MAG TPA: GxxExxY protein [Terriglobales bacterium]|nr:GxxExxY protein [Terriglobales bacterium]